MLPLVFCKRLNDDKILLNPGAWDWCKYFFLR